MEPNFPSSELIQMYQCDNHSYFSGMSGYFAFQVANIVRI